MSEQDSSAFTTEQFEVLYPPGVEHHYWNLCRNRVIARMLRRSGADGPILEVGCGKGLVTKALRERGFDVRGVEIAPVPPLPGMEAHVRSSFDVFAMEPMEAATYRTVMLLDVIEHLEDPERFLRMLRGKFTGCTMLLVTVPARQELFSNYDRFNGHHLRYDRATLTRHLTAWSGKGAFELRYFFHVLYPSARWLLALRGKRPVHFTVPASWFSRSVHKLIGLLLFADHLLIPGNTKGTSLLGIQRT